MLLALLTVAAAAPAIDETKLVDLTHPFDDKAIYWPTAKPFTWEKESWGRNAQGDWYTAGRYSASEHGGTHLDAPIHFGEGKQTIDQIPIDKLVGPAIVIDVSEAVAWDRDYRLSPSDIAAWEAKHGQIPAGSIVLVRTGWQKHWGDKLAYLGTDKPGDTANLHFPGISKASERSTLSASIRRAWITDPQGTSPRTALSRRRTSTGLRMSPTWIAFRPSARR
jgi:kynurenine formamidase